MNKYFIFLIPLCLCTLTLDESNTLQAESNQEGYIVGTMSANGINYQAACNCGAPTLNDVEAVKCAPTKIKLTQDTKGEGSSWDDISKRLSDLSEFEYAKVTSTSLRCLDGRITEPMIGTPGGDMGEFIIGLQVYESLTGRELQQSDVTQYLQDYVGCMQQSQFYMCTDDTSVSHMSKQLAINGINIYKPRAEIRDMLLQILVQPENVGDLHLKNMLMYPDIYSIRKEIIQFALRAFYVTLWGQDPISNSLTLDVLTGDHEETAFLEIRTNDECNLEQVSPLITPREAGLDGMSVYVNHIDAAAIRRAQIAQFFSERIARNQDNITSERMLQVMNHHGLLYLDQTGSFVAKDLPFYTAQFVQ